MSKMHNFSGGFVVCNSVCNRAAEVLLESRVTLREISEYFSLNCALYGTFSLTVLIIEVRMLQGNHKKFRRFCKNHRSGGGGKSQLRFQRAKACAERAIYYRPSVCLSVRLSVTPVDLSKIVEVRFMQHSRRSSPIPPSTICDEIYYYAR